MSNMFLTPLINTYKVKNMNITAFMPVTGSTNPRAKIPSFKTNTRKYIQHNSDLMGCTTCMLRDDLYWRGFSDFVLKNFKNKDKVNVVMFASSDGSEAYSTIISLLENSKDKNETAQKFFPIKAYDIDEEIVKAAKSGYINTRSVDRMNLLMHCEDYYKYFSKTDRQLVIDADPASTNFNNDDYCDLKTFKAKRILTDNVKFNQGDMFSKLQELKDNSDTVLMCRNVLGYFENDKIENFVKLASQKLKSGSIFVVGEHDFVLYNLDECLKNYGFEKIMTNVYKKA